MTDRPITTKTHRIHGGTLHYDQHGSLATGTAMKYSIFIPPGAGPFPYVIWLSGLTCTEDNFTTKAGAYAAAARLGLAVVAPDTSPRGEGVPDDPAYDLGQGAGFYLDATQAPWARHFKMETYITRDLIEAVETQYPLHRRRSILGHSMGGHGALVLAMRNQGMFESVSAFAPISSAPQCPWGEKALEAYLGKDRELWRGYDASSLIESGASGRFDDILVDQGLADQFLASQLKPELLERAAEAVGRKLTLRRHKGYDHSYFFISTFIADHLAFHAERLT